MTKRTRLFLFIGGGVLVAGVATGLVASYMGLPAIALGGADGPRELAYVPRDAHLVAYANVRELMGSEVRRKLLPLRPDHPGRADFETRTGINPETDIDTVVVSFEDPSTQEHNRGGLVLARGRFDEVRIEAFIRGQGGQVSEYRGKRLMTHAGDRGPGTAVAFLEPGLAAVGTSDAVRQALDAASSGKGDITDNEEVMVLVRDIGQANAWAVGRFDALVNRARLPQEIATQLPPIHWFSARGYVNGGVEGGVRVEARDQTAARDLREVLQGFMALARLQTGQSELAHIIELFHLGGQGTTVSLDFSIPAELLDGLASELQRRRSAPAQERLSPPTAPLAQ